MENLKRDNNLRNHNRQIAEKRRKIKQNFLQYKFQTQNNSKVILMDELDKEIGNIYIL